MNSALDETLDIACSKEMHSTTINGGKIVELHSTSDILYLCSSFTMSLFKYTILKVKLHARVVGQTALQEHDDSSHCS